MSSDPVKIPFEKVLKSLLDEKKPLPARYIYRLSDLEGKDRLALEATWPQISLRRRQALMEDIQNLGEEDYLLDFSVLGRLALHDLDVEVRQLGVEILAEYELPEFISEFLRLAEQDAEPAVRASAASALGVYVYMGEVEEIPEKSLQKVVDTLLRITQTSESPQVRRHALEALGFSSRPEVTPLIQAAYQSGDLEWQVSALFAMGRSSSVDWANQVIAKLDDFRPQVRAEAVSAAGELSLRAATSTIIGLLEDEDDDVRAAAIWSLSEIGGKGIKEVLEEKLEQAEEDEEIDLLEDALENLAFVEDFEVFGLLDVEEDDLDELIQDEDDQE